MPGLKDLLKKKEKIANDTQTPASQRLDVPEFTFIRSTTESEEVIQPPSYPEDDQRPTPSKEKKRYSLAFRNSSNAAVTKDPTALSAAAETSSQQLPARVRGERRLSERFHIHRNRNRSASAESSSNLPEDLPEVPEGIGSSKVGNVDGAGDEETKEQREAQWEKRATILAMNNPLRDGQIESEQGRVRGRSRSPSISDAKGDVNIQEAIRLHEEGDLTKSTEMFAILASPKGANNALSQVLYGLALRHGWGIPVEPEKAVHYLSLAASNSASIEEQALASGMKKGGAAKGELVLAIFELANCFRHGWGVKKDAVAARQYYECAANLGDPDAMEEAAWCYTEGFGGAKDKVCTPPSLSTHLPRDLLHTDRDPTGPCPSHAPFSYAALLLLTHTPTPTSCRCWRHDMTP